MNNLPDHIISLIEKSNDNTINREELKVLSEWLKLDESQQLLDSYLTPTDGQLVNDLKIENHDVLWQNILSKVQEQNSKESLQVSYKSNYRYNFFNWKTIGIAACLSFIILFSLYNARNFNRSEKVIAEQPTRWIKKSTVAGQKLTLNLADGSKVKLNNLSSLSFREDFDKDSIRLVKLEGEAFFEVSKGNIPFVVESGDVKTKVLGTSFNIKSGESHNNVNVAVVTGKVSVQKQEDLVYLLPEEMAVVKTNYIEKTGYDKDNVLAWKEGILKINASDFGSIIKQLEIWYGVEIKIIGNAPQKGIYDKTYDNAPLDRVLNGLSFIADFSYNIDNKNVEINFN